MKAIQYTDFSDDVKEVKLVEIEKPTASPGFAIVRVVSAAGNPIDHMVHKGLLNGAGWRTPFPFTMGYDFAGVVDSVSAEDTDNIAVGEEVFAVNWGQHQHDEGDLPIGGAFAEYIRVPISKLSKKPSGISFNEAAAVALVGTTAYQTLFECAKLTAGSKALILGAASSVGQVAIQLAKSRGVWVAATCSGRTMEFASQLGADKLINYREANWEDDADLKGIDAVIDTVGDKDGFSRSISTGVVKEGGSFVTISSFDAGFVPDAHAPRLSFGALFGLSNDTAVQDELAKMLSNGTLKMKIDKLYPFTEGAVHDMLARIESGTSVGKNVIEISAP
ncbi:unnamed protein product [Ectocarpus fasciculatus]